jgi:predicted XRE-type DNA-binding protein
MHIKEIKYIESSGNVFEDLGFQDADEQLAKAKLVFKINSILDNRKLKQIDAAKILGINQPKISALKNGKLTGFSLEKLIHYLNLLNQDVEIVIKPKTKKLNTIGKLKVAFC